MIGGGILLSLYEHIQSRVTHEFLVLNLKFELGRTIYLSL